MKNASNSTAFTESNLTFSFDNQWVIYKFDNHRFYKQLAGRNVKGVDFIGIFQEKTLVLIEVKNYVDRYLHDSKNPSEDFLNNQSSNLQDIAKKYVDSLRVIEAVQKAYQQKWWYRLAQKTLFRLIKLNRLPNWEFVFWTKAWQFANSGNLQLILWLEIEQLGNMDFKIVAPELSMVIEIMDSRNNGFKKSLRVELM